MNSINKIAKNHQKSSTKGFTLVELLLVIGIIATLAVVVFVALDPATRFRDARNARRTSDVETILSAVHQYIIDNKGSFPSGLDADDERMLGAEAYGCTNGNGGCNAPDGCLDLSAELVRYLKEIPYDPTDGSSSQTQYTVLRDSNGLVTVRACSAEESQVYVSR